MGSGSPEAAAVGQSGVQISRLGSRYVCTPSGGRASAGAAGPVGQPPSRYFGRVKTKFQVYLAATVANLTLELGKIGLSGSTGGGAEGHRVVLNDVRAVVANAAANFNAVRLGQLWSLILLTSALLPQLHFQIRQGNRILIWSQKLAEIFCENQLRLERFGQSPRESCGSCPVIKGQTQLRF